MKTLFIIAYLIPVFAFAQQSKSLTLTVLVKDCRDNINKYITYWDTVQFFKDTALVSQIIPSNYKKQKINIKNFKSGTYTMYYRNYYGTQVSKIIVIPNNVSSYKLVVCPDELSEHPFNSLSDLKDGEEIKIEFSSAGCSYHTHEILIILKMDTSFIAKLTDGTKQISNVINKAGIEAFKRFENELHEVPTHYGCTTTDFYTMINKTDTLKNIDDGCTWNGFTFLKNSLFKKTK